MNFDVDTLLQMDAACRFTRETNRANGGRWWDLGVQTFRGMELYGQGVFERMLSTSYRGKTPAVNWKRRYLRFAVGVKVFGAPFYKSEISGVPNDDEVAYFRCLLRTDPVEDAATGVYLEVEVLTNPDNFSLAVVDFDEGGSSSLTFSPDTGAVINERKICESPRKVQGTYIQPLSAITANHPFLGSVGLYLRGGRLAFFRRRCSEGSGSHVEPWESTGFVTDVAWAQGQRLTPCVAFRSAGKYKVRATRVDTTPPFLPKPVGKDHALEWSSLDWEATGSDL